MTRDEMIENLYESLYLKIKCAPATLRRAIVEEVYEYLLGCDEARFCEDEDYCLQVWTDAHDVVRKV